MLGPDHAPSARPRRVLVAGTSGSGKTTLGARIGEVWDLPHVEIDALFHGPDWTPRASFIADVEAFSRQDRWVTEWQYHSVRDLLADRADLLVWLDLPRALVMRQIIGRTLSRRLCRQELWNGNLEPALWTALRDPNHIVRWAWRTHAQTAVRIEALQDRRPDLPIVRLTSHHETKCWLHSMRTPGA
ncbi:MAG: hypothetical protein WCF36_07255 [Candidatus Nanopelagicales bacterium]